MVGVGRSRLEPRPEDRQATGPNNELATTIVKSTSLSANILGTPLAAERLYPRRYAHNYYILTRMRTVIAEAIGKYIDGNAADTRLIDYGCGDIPYLPLFADKIARYVTCDIESNPLAEVKIGKDSRVPLSDASFDIVFSIQVLEHVDDVTQYLSEAHRLLNRDGLLLLSTHGQWIWHPFPKDLWRWTHEGLARTIEGSGFEIVDTMWIMGSLAYSSQLRVFYLKRTMIGKGPILRGLFYAASFIYNAVMALQDKLEGHGGKENAAMYLLVAKKRAPVTARDERQETSGNRNAPTS